MSQHLVQSIARAEEAAKRPLTDLEKLRVAESLLDAWEARMTVLVNADTPAEAGNAIIRLQKPKH